MNSFILFTLIGLLIWGIIYTYRLATQFAKKKEEEKCTSMDLISEASPVDLACMMVFGPFVIAIRRIIRKVMSR